MPRVFFDTNVLIYADDLDAGPKRLIARELLRQAYANHTGVVSTQVLQEFFAVSTRKLGVEPDIARRKVSLLAKLDVVVLDVATILGAIDLHRLHSVSWWDALIIKAAANAGCETVLTEDVQHGQVIEGVRLENPFL